MSGYELSQDSQEHYPFHLKPALTSLVLSLGEVRLAYDQARVAGKDFPPESWPERDDRVGFGGHAQVYKIEAQEGPLAVKFFHDKNEMPDQLMAYQKAKGVPHVVQLKGYSLEHGFIVMEYLDDEMDSPEPTGCTDEQIAELVQAAVDLHARGLGGELHSGNVLYTPERGFTLVDYEIEYGTTDLKAYILGLEDAIFVAMHGNISPEFDEYLKLSDEAEARLATVLKRYFPDILSESNS